MAYTLIATQTLVAPSGTVTFSNIPGTFKDLMLESVSQSNDSTGDISIRINGDSGTNYSMTRLLGTGTSAVSDRSTNTTSWFNIQSTSSQWNALAVHIMSYANTNVNKTALIRNAASEVLTHSALWRNTGAVSSLTIFGRSGGNVLAGSTFKLWGVA